MTKKHCIHSWQMINVISGLIVMKKCFHCMKVSACFCRDCKPPLEESREGNHFWDFVESEPAIHFDLKCGKCGEQVMLNELVGLMTLHRL